jgi:hypothetical protein
MPWKHIEDTTPRARKQYTCFLCNRAIAVGEQHVRRYGIDDDGRAAIRMHTECEQLTKDWDEDNWAFSDPADFAAHLDELRSESCQT